MQPIFWHHKGQKITEQKSHICKFWTNFCVFCYIFGLNIYYNEHHDLECLHRSLKINQNLFDWVIWKQHSIFFFTLLVWNQILSMLYTKFLVIVTTINFISKFNKSNAIYRQHLIQITVLRLRWTLHRLNLAIFIKRNADCLLELRINDYKI
jgi:hypothetical protein